MFICNRCGDLVSYLPSTYSISEYWGSNVAEKQSDSDCSCGGTYVEAYICELCGNWFKEEDFDI